MPKLDLVRERQELYKPPVREPVLVTVPEMAFLTVDGTGDPKTAPEYSQALEAPYAVSYGAKFKVKRGPGGVDHKVMPLEGLWWSDDMTAFDREKGELEVDDDDRPAPAVNGTIIDQAVAEAGRKKDLPSLGKLRFERFEEGLGAPP